MRQRIFIFLLSAIFLLSQVNIVEAKGSSGRSSSGSRSSSFSSSKSSSKSSGGYSGSSSSKNSGGSSGSSSSKNTGSSSKSTDSGTTKSSGGYSGSASSRTVPDSFSSGGSSKKPAADSSSGNTKPSTASTKSETMKNTYMQDKFKQQASGSNFKTYNQNLNDSQKNVYDSSINKSYDVKKRLSFEDAMRTRNQRIYGYDTRPVRMYVNKSYFGGPLSYGSAFAGIWDMWFLMRASDLFWYHHWNELHAYRDHFDSASFAARENAIREMEAKNIIRDSNYLDSDVDPDLQFSNDYLQRNPNSVYYTNKYNRTTGNPFVAILIILIIIVILIIIIRKVTRRRPKDAFNSRIY